MIILKATNETLQATTGPGPNPPIRKGSSHAVGAGSSITISPDGTIAVGDWMVLVVASYDGINIDGPSAGWILLQPPTVAGTQNTAIYGKMRAAGDASYTISLSGGGSSSDATLLWGSGADTVGAWQVGAVRTRAAIAPATATGSLAPSLTTIDDHMLVLAISTERTIVDESDIVSMQGAEKWVYYAQFGGAALQTTTVGVMPDVSPAGATGDVRIEYSNAQASNAQAIQIGIPRARLTLIDSSISYADAGTVGSTYSSQEAKVQQQGSLTFFPTDTPAAQNNTGDPAAVELGVAFTTSANIVVTALRYYKGVGASAAAKTGHLWTNDGALLLTLPFTNDTASGWQVQQLATPITLTAGSTYIVSYHSPNGNYAYTENYFTAPITNGPVTINPSNAGLNNGIYEYGPSPSFPKSTYVSSNYFVDIMFAVNANTSDTPVLSNPVTNMTRTVKLASFVNRTTTTSTMSINKMIGTTKYKLTPDIPLAPSEMLQYVDGIGWKLHAADGTVKANFAAPTTVVNQIVTNTNGLLSGDSNLGWVPQKNTLKVTGASANVTLTTVATIPSIATPNSLKIFGQKIAGKNHLSKQGPAGDVEAIQASLWQNNICLWTPSNNVGTWFGINGANVGASAVQVQPTMTNIYTGMRRSTFATAAAANSQAGLRSDAGFFRSTSPGSGGFFYVCRFGFSTITTTTRAFIGMAASTVILTAEPSTVFNICGFGFDSTDNAWYFIHNDAAGVATKDVIPGQGTLATPNSAYDAYIWNPPNSNNVYYRLDRIDTGVTVVEGMTNTDLPVVNTMLMAAAHVGNGPTAGTIGDMTLGVNRMYMEANR